MECREREFEGRFVRQCAQQPDDGGGEALDQHGHRLELLALGLDVDLASGRLLDGDVVLQDFGDPLEREEDDLMEYLWARDAVSLDGVFVGLVEVGGTAKRDDDLSGSPEGARLVD